MTIDEVRALALTLPRSSEGHVRGRVKFRVGRIVYLSLSRDGSTMGFAFPKEWREALSSSPTRTNSHYRASLTSAITGLTSAWLPSTPTKCAILSRTPGRLSCRNAWPRSTRHRGVTSSCFETPGSPALSRYDDSPSACSSELWLQRRCACRMRFFSDQRLRTAAIPRGFLSALQARAPGSPCRSRRRGL